jgi:hypothetical protein
LTNDLVDVYHHTHTSTTPRNDFILDLVESIDPGTSRLFVTSGGKPKHRSRYLSYFYHIWWRTQGSIAVPFGFFYHISWKTQALIPVPLVFLSHLVDNPSIDPGTSRLSFHMWWRTQASIQAPLVFFSHLVENPSIDPATTRLLCHIWWRTQTSISVRLDYLLSHLMENLASISVPFNILSHLVENPVPLVILVTNMWSY